MSAKRRGLGRGLDALLATSQSASRSEDGEAVTSQNSELRKLPIEFLQPGKYQPRKDMSPEALEELASSIRSQGVIQPIVVRLVSTDKYDSHIINNLVRLYFYFKNVRSYYLFITR